MFLSMALVISIGIEINIFCTYRKAHTLLLFYQLAKRSHLTAINIKMFLHYSIAKFVEMGNPR